MFLIALMCVLPVVLQSILLMMLMLLFSTHSIHSMLPRVSFSNLEIPGLRCDGGLFRGPFLNLDVFSRFVVDFLRNRTC